MSLQDMYNKGRAAPTSQTPQADTSDPNVFPNTTAGLKAAQTYAKKMGGTVMYYVEVPGPQQPQ